MTSHTLLIISLFNGLYLYMVSRVSNGLTVFSEIGSLDQKIIIIFLILQNTNILVFLKRQFDPDQLLLKNVGLSMKLLEDRECQYLLN